jgi:hypothetical protein
MKNNNTESQIEIMRRTEQKEGKEKSSLGKINNLSYSKGYIYNKEDSSTIGKGIGEVRKERYIKVKQINKRQFDKDSTKPVQDV